MSKALTLPRDADGNWPLVLMDLLTECGDPWSIQAVIEAFVETYVDRVGPFILTRGEVAV